MSGHSHWSTIQRQKGTADAKRGQVFTKIASLITVAAKVGGSGDPDTNPRLRMVLDTARSANMPKENIQRAIDRGLGKLPGQTLEEVTYEGFGPAKVAFIIEGITDNKLRILSEVRNLFERSGGGLGNLGSVSYMFDRIGEIKVKSKGGVKDDEMLELIDFGATDVEDFEEDNIQKYLVYVDRSNLITMGNNITQGGYEVQSREIVYKPNTLVEITDKESAQRVIGLAEKLEENGDVQKVYMNADFKEGIF